MNKKSVVIILSVALILAAYYFLVPDNPIKKALNTGSNVKNSTVVSDNSDSSDNNQANSETEAKDAKIQRENGQTQGVSSGSKSSDQSSTDSSDDSAKENVNKDQNSINTKNTFDPKTYARGGKIKPMPALKADNQNKIFNTINGLKPNMDKSDCPDLIKAQKGTDFNCRTVVKNPLLSSKIIYESAYKNGRLVSFQSKVAGAKEVVSVQTNVNKRIANNKKKAVKSKKRASNAVKFSLEDRDFLEIYFDENFMTDELQYYYYDLKQAVLRDEFYKEKDFQKRVDLVILAINKSIKVINDQCKVQQYDKACEAYKKYLKINIREDIKKIISAAESAKIESAFFD